MIRSTTWSFCPQIDVMMSELSGTERLIDDRITRRMSRLLSRIELKMMVLRSGGGGEGGGGSEGEA